MQDSSARHANQPTVAVVVCTYNGARFLKPQLDSIANQSLAPVTVLISDDGSTDGSLEIASQFANDWTQGQVLLSEGPQKGFAANFLSGLAGIDPATHYVALSDQDDIWMPEKLERAVKKLESYGDTPALYGATTLEWNAEKDTSRVSRLATVKLGFRHAIGQNFAGGNTMVLNNAALRVVLESQTRDVRVPVHDWWLYQLISGAGGQVVFDPEPCLYYRQHDANQIGSATGLAARANRLVRMARGEYREWNTSNLLALQSCRDLLTPDNRDVTDQVAQGRNAGPLQRLSLLKRPGLYRQGRIGQLGLVLALALGRY